MTAEIYQLRDYQPKKDIERMQREPEKEAAKILAETDDCGPNESLRKLMQSPAPWSETVPYGGKGIDGMTFNGDETA